MQGCHRHGRGWPTGGRRRRPGATGNCAREVTQARAAAFQRTRTLTSGDVGVQPRKPCKLRRHGAWPRSRRQGLILSDLARRPIQVATATVTFRTAVTGRASEVRSAVPVGRSDLRRCSWAASQRRAAPARRLGRRPPCRAAMRPRRRQCHRPSPLVSVTAPDRGRPDSRMSAAGVTRTSTLNVMRSVHTDGFESCGAK